MLHRLVIVCALGLMLATAYFAGGQTRGVPRGSGPVEPAGAQLTELTADLELVRQQLANVQAGLEIEREASARVRGDLAAAQLRIAQLEQEAQLYRGLLDSTVRRNGLSLHSLEVAAMEQERNYRLRIVLVQRARNYGELAGDLRLGVHGHSAGASQTLAYADIGIPRGIHAIPVRLRYFLVVEGRVELPQGFEPEAVMVEVNVTEGGRQRLRERRDWVL